MAAATRSSSVAPSRSEQRARSTSHRFGATCASDVTLGGEASDGAAGAVGGAGCCCAADGCAHARQPTNKTVAKSFSIIVPLSDHFTATAVVASITGARIAGRTLTYRIAERA